MLPFCTRLTETCLWVCPGMCGGNAWVWEPRSVTQTSIHMELVYNHCNLIYWLQWMKCIYVYSHLYLWIMLRIRIHVQAHTPTHKHPHTLRSEAIVSFLPDWRCLPCHLHSGFVSLLHLHSWTYICMAIKFGQESKLYIIILHPVLRCAYYICLGCDELNSLKQLLAP